MTPFVRVLIVFERCELMKIAMRFGLCVSLCLGYGLRCLLASSALCEARMELSKAHSSFFQSLAITSLFLVLLVFAVTPNIPTMPIILPNVG